MMTEEENINLELLFSFFWVFRRFEAALRMAGYVKPGGRSQVDWGRFVTEIDESFVPEVRPEVNGAYCYLLGMSAKGRAKAYAGQLMRMSAVIEEMGRQLERDLQMESIPKDPAALVAAMTLMDAWAVLQKDVKRAWLEMK